MAATYTPSSTSTPKKSCVALNDQKWQPRDERLRMPQKNASDDALSTTQQRSSVTVPRGPPPSPRQSSESSHDDPGSPKVVEFQALAGAEVKGRPWQFGGPRKASQETCRSGTHSEVSNVLEYYLRDSSPLQSPPLSSIPSVRPKDSAIAAFDFGLSSPKSAVQPSKPEASIGSGAASCVRPLVDKTTGVVPAPSTPTYSLFPPSTKGLSMDPNMRPISLHCGKTRPPLNQLQPGITMAPVRPRKASLPSSLRSRADSCTSIRLLPSATITPGNTTIPSSGRFPRRPLPLRVSSCIPTAPPSDQGSRTSTPTRWSGDTVALSPGSPSVKDRSSTSSSAWPQTGSFFEDDDDDDEEVPLRKKVAIKIRGARAWSSSSTATSESTVKISSQQKGMWSRWIACCVRRRT